VLVGRQFVLTVERRSFWVLCVWFTCMCYLERWGAGVETQKNVRGEVGGWGRVPFNELFVFGLPACVYGVAPISRLLKIIGLFCRISSLS